MPDPRLLFVALLSCATPERTPLVIGETFALPSRILGETRRIQVFTPHGVELPSDGALPVLYMLDGGLGEDFLHIAGLLQVGAMNGTLRPFRLIGIENTQRRRDLTGATTSPEDRKIAPVVGGSAAFRRFLRDELIPEVARRYATTREKALLGESLAGLFVVETFVLAPDLFDRFVAVDPSLWWAEGALLAQAETERHRLAPRGTTLHLASSSEPTIAPLVARFAELVGARLHTLPEETHGTVFHPAALRALRVALKP